MFCSRCGKPIAEDAQFCAHCGHSIHPTGPSAKESPSIAPPASSKGSVNSSPPGLIERAKNILISPSIEWEKIAGEGGSTSSLYVGYIMPLAAIGPLANFVGMSLIGTSIPLLGHYRAPLAAGFAGMIAHYVLTLAGVFLISLLVNALAPSFGGRKDAFAALKVTAYSYTAAWVAGIFHLLPMLGVLGLLAALYGLYLLYLGLPPLMRCPKDKALGYTVVVVICAIVITVLISLLVGVIGLGRMGMMGAWGAMGSRLETPDTSSERTAGFISKLFGGKSDEDAQRVNEALQKLNQLGEQAKRSEKAAKSGEPGATPTPEDVGKALGAVGQVLAGGKNIEPVDFRDLKAMLPEVLAGLPKSSASGERGEGMGMKASHAKGHYGDEQRSVDLEITDLGSMSGLASFAASFNPKFAREDDRGYERTTTVNGQLVHEKFQNQGRRGEVAVIVGNRFSVEIKGRGVDMDVLKAALSEIDLARLGALASK